MSCLRRGGSRKLALENGLDLSLVFNRQAGHMAWPVWLHLGIGAGERLKLLTVLPEFQCWF
jgi:hypothetical protein